MGWGLEGGGWCTWEKGGACRWGSVHVGWDGDVKVGAGAHGRRAACMGGGRRAWEEGGVHGRRAACMGGGRCAWEEGSTHGRRVACIGGQPAWEENGAHGRRVARMGGGGAHRWGPATPLPPLLISRLSPPLPLSMHCHCCCTLHATGRCPLCAATTTTVYVPPPPHSRCPRLHQHVRGGYPCHTLDGDGTRTRGMECKRRAGA